MEKIYGMHKLVGLQLFLCGTPTFSSGTPTFGQMGVLNSCFQNPSESSGGPESLTWINEHDILYSTMVAILTVRSEQTVLLLVSNPSWFVWFDSLRPINNLSVI